MWTSRVAVMDALSRKGKTGGTVRDFAAFCALLACVFVFFASIIALIRPLPKLRMGTRKRALGGVGLSFVLFIATAIIMPPPTTEKAAAVVDRRETASSADKPVEVAAMTAEQDRVVSFARHLIVQTVACNSGVDTAQGTVDKAAAQSARPIDAYDDAKSAAKFCSDAKSDISAATNDFTGDGRKIAGQAIKFCGDAASDRADAMKLLMKVLDVEASLEAASQYREKKNSGAGHDYACRMTIQGLVERANVPASAVDFVKPS